MDREHRTMELLQLLGEDVAEAVLLRLQPGPAEKIRTGLKADTGKLSTIRRQRAVLDEFECFFQFALKSQAADAANSSARENESGESAKAASEESGSEDVSEEKNAAAGSALLDAGDAMQTSASAGVPDLTESESAPNGDEQEPLMAGRETISFPAVTEDPLRDLRSLSSHQLAQALCSEQPRTSAILLSSLPAKLTGDVLNLLKPEYQKAVMKELTREQHAPAVLVERIARATFARANQFPSEPPDKRDHADRVAEVLRNVPKAGRRNMLAAIEEQDPELARSLLTRIYRFDDIASMGKTAIQRTLGEIDSANLTTALYGAPQEITDAVYANLSKRARQTIEEEMQFMSNLPESRILQARNAIAEIIAKIDMETES